MNFTSLESRLGLLPLGILDDPFLLEEFIQFFSPTKRGVDQGLSSGKEQNT